MGTPLSWSSACVHYNVHKASHIHNFGLLLTLHRQTYKHILTNKYFTIIESYMRRYYIHRWGNLFN